MKVTFLEGYRRLSKSYTESGVVSYPLVKRVTSHCVFTPSLEARVEAIREHANAGHCLLKGHLTKELNQESRAGQTDNESPTDTIIFDIDGLQLDAVTIEPPLNQHRLQEIAEMVIAKLPTIFHTASYIVHASASMGVKPNRISMHIEFALAQSVFSAQLKRYLQVLNLTLPVFRNQLDLTATGTALKYKLDISLADNSRLIFIAPPTFDGVENPIPEDNDRIFLVSKAIDRVEIPEKDLNIDPVSHTRKIKEMVAIIREDRGLPKIQAHTSPIVVSGETHNVVTNPDGCRMQYSYDNDKYVYYNINGGDSNAYYVRKDSPSIVWNFKGEPPFMFEQADPEAFQQHIEQFVLQDENATAEVPPIPVGFNDIHTNVYYRGLVDRVHNKVMEMSSTDRAGINDWMIQYAYPTLEHVPVWSYKFDPTDPRSVDLPGQFINQYVESPLIAEPAEIPEEFKGLTRGTGHTIEEICPAIFKVLKSVLGCGELELEHFLNWLACIVQNKEKNFTCWVLHGTQGTGKGALFNHVLAPMFNSERSQHAFAIRTENVDEQFNAWLEKGLLVMLDEYNDREATSQKALANKIKNYITEPTVTLRGMRKDTRIIDSFINFIITSNDRDCVRIDEGDRRFNVAPRQEMKLFERFPELEENLVAALKREAPYFASIMVHFNVNAQAARTCIENKAKENLRKASRTSVEDFIEALRTGDLDFFMPIMEMEDDGAINSPIMPAQNAIRHILDNFENEAGVPMWTQHLLNLYNAMYSTGKRMNAASFTKMLQRAGLENFGDTKLMINNVRRKGTRIQFHLGDYELTELKDTYLVKNPNNITSMTR